ncbi:YCF48-related protein [Paenibacillus psychroresistens]|nr:YCF48-related protein [Paenibacillus psychroresistens]
MSLFKNLKIPLMIILALTFLAGCSSTKAENSGTPDTNISASPVQAIATTTSVTPIPSAVPTASLVPAAEVPQDIPMDKVTAVRIASPLSGWVGGSGWIAKTANGGKEWKIQYAGEGTIHQIFALDDQHAWATIEEDTSLLVTSDGGLKWTKLSQVPNLGFLHFVSLTEGFVASEKTIDGGKTWTKLKIPASIVGDAYFHDKDHGWAVTQTKAGFQVQRTVDGGSTWKTVLSKKSETDLNAIIRSAGVNDAWVELIGDSGMTQTSYSVIHTIDGGSHWQTVIANSTAGGGPAPGFPSDYTDGPNNQGNSPGPLYVVDPKTAYMGGQCMACDKPNSVGWTHDGGKTWVNGKQTFEGFDAELLAIADEQNGWLITTDTINPSVLYTTTNGGVLWNKIYTFATPKKAE